MKYYMNYLRFKILTLIIIEIDYLYLKVNSYVLTCQSHQLNGVDFLLYKNGLRAEQTQYDG